VKTRPSRPSWAAQRPAAARVAELGQQREQDQQALGVEAADADAADQQGAVAAAGHPGRGDRRGWGGERPRPVPHQVEATGHGERGEHVGGPGDQGADARGDHAADRGVADGQAADRSEHGTAAQPRAEGVAGIPHVVQAQRLFGDPDYLLRIVTTDLAAYQRLQDEQLSALPGVSG
jgi:hypothetical protein